MARGDPFAVARGIGHTVCSAYFQMQPPRISLRI